MKLPGRKSKRDFDPDQVLENASSESIPNDQVIPHAMEEAMSEKSPQLIHQSHVSREIVPRKHSLITRLLLSLPPQPLPAERRPSPEDTCNILSRLFWGFVYPQLRTGFDRILEIEDSWKVPQSQRNENRMIQFNRYVKKWQDKGYVNFVEIIATIEVIKTWLFLHFCSSISFLGSLYGNTVLARHLIVEVDKIYLGVQHNHGPAVGMAIGICLLGSLSSWSILQFEYLGQLLSEAVRTILISASYSKMFRLSPLGHQKLPAAKIIALTSTDINRISVPFNFLTFQAALPFAFAGLIYVLIYNLGVAALVGIGLMFTMLIANFAISISQGLFRKKSLPFSDKRVALIRETLENMRIVKFYGWEKPYVERITNVRAQEAKWLKRLAFVQGGNGALLTSAPAYAGALSFVVRVLIGHALSPERAFPSLTLFNILAPLCSLLAASISTLADAWTSAKRLNLLFRGDEMPNYVQIGDIDMDPSVGVKIQDGSFQWATSDDDETNSTASEAKIAEKHNENSADHAVEPNSAKVDSTDDDARVGSRKFAGLHDVNVSIEKGRLAMVVGSIGSGKTTLLSSMIGVVPKLSGSVSTCGPSASVLSTWSLNATVRDNITFGCAYDAAWYAQVVHACCLESDFSQFEKSDLTEIGERGISLSGGQRARLALARCIYSRSDVIILDDVLSAVDAKVARKIFDRCISGIVRDKTRIMSTHNWGLLSKGDQVIYLDGTGRVESGTLPELLKSSQGFAEMYHKFDSAAAEKVAEMSNEPTSLTDLTLSPKEPEKDLELYDDDIHQVAVAANIEANLNVNAHSAAAAVPSSEYEIEPIASASSSNRSGEKETNQIVSSSAANEEERERGTVKGVVLVEYFTNGEFTGLLLCTAAVVCALVYATSSSMQSVFLNWWTGDKYKESLGFNIGVYSAIVSATAIMISSTIGIIGYFCMTSSSRLHRKAIENLYRAPMSFFDVTPLGRIVNRFTNDMAQLDTQLFLYLRQLIMSAMTTVGSMVVTFVYVPWAAVVLAPILVFVYIIFTFYRASSRELKRISTLYRSKVFTTLSEAISGAAVIDSYRRVEQFKTQLEDQIDDMNYSFTVNEASIYWMSFRVFSTIQLLSIVTMLLAIFQVFKLNASEVGLLLSMLEDIPSALGQCIPMFIQVENELNSVERLYEYAHKIPQEAPRVIADHRPPKEWPQAGKVKFEHASLRYREGLPLVMDDLSVTFEAGEKIGICGRTGAGKSTLLAALFRIVELSAGKLTIDDVDISTIGLGDLRSKLSIIPQEPVLFEGTIRSNLDPFDERTDAELWDALRRSGVLRQNEITAQGDVSREHKFHLDMNVEGDGSNFSLGERQLLTLARALVRQSRILVLDEATAAVDFETDNMIQQTIATEFTDCTILCIAHRLKTIINYDKIVVLEAGHLEEMGEPRQLFEDENSAFGAMCREAGIVEEDLTR